MSLFEYGELIQVDLGLENRETYEAAARMIRDHYTGAVAAVFMDKDETMQDPDAELPSDDRLGDYIAQAQSRGIWTSIDSNSSPFDLITLGSKLEMKGLHVAERGAVICGFPDGSEIHLIHGGEWLNRTLLNRFCETIRADRELGNDTVIVVGDPWALIHSDTRFPGSQRKLVMLNGGRHASASFVSGLLDPEGRIVRGTEDSRAFFRKMAELFLSERERLNKEIPFPDSDGMLDDVSEKYEVSTIVSNSASKRKAMDYMAKVLNIPVFHIGDSEQDNMTGVPDVTTMAVGNNTLKDVSGVIAAQSEMATGVIELFEQHIFPQFS